MMKMKTLVSSIAFLFSISLYASSPSKVALIVAVGNYPEASGWTSLNSKNDIALIQSALIRQGFDEKDILIISDEQATRIRILEAFNEHLIGKAKKGGMAVFHFSGHGQQVADNNQDEIDQFDEAIVPFDSPMHFKKGIYEGERLIRDDELGNLLLELRKGLGKNGQVMVLLDACHSGTGTRGLGKARGTGIKMASKNYQAIQQNDFKEVNELNEGGRTRRNIAPMVAFFASSANELNYETRDKYGLVCGSLSYAFSKSFSSIDKNTSYRGLFDQIKVEMAANAPRQTPQSEGNLDQIVMGGEINGNSRHFSVLKSYDDLLIIDGGTLAGLHQNTNLHFYPIDTKDTSEVDPIARGTILFSELFTSEVHLDRVLSSSEALESWVFVESQNYGDLSVRLQIDLQENNFGNILKEKIREYPVIQLVDGNPDLFIHLSEDENQLILETKEAFVLLRESLFMEEIFVNKVIEEALKFAQTRFIRNLEMQNPWMDLKLELIPVRERMTNNKLLLDDQDINTKTGTDGIVRFKEGDKFKIKITNLGERPAYYALIDIQPDNEINLLLPETYLKRKAEEYYIHPGQTHVLPVTSDTIENYWTFSPPFGNEVFKLIVTQEPLDLKSAIVTRGASSARKLKNAHPFEILFGSTFKKNNRRTRGAATPNIPPNSAQINTFVFKIVE